jgi:ethanolamine ammonia-lyase small subunit
LNENLNIQPTTNPSDQWSDLKQFTTARIALGRTGTAIPLKEVLAFKMAHADARDAVHSELNIEQLCYSITELQANCIVLQSKATDRTIYLKRPDFGRKLNEESVKQLQLNSQKAFDISITIADGLSATAVNEHAINLIKELLPLFNKNGFGIATICLAKQARVAIADEIALLQKAKFSIILIGERPGLGSADSMGAYLTFSPKPGLADNSRNCISNIRSEGLAINLAAKKILYFAKESFRLQLSGVGLKDDHQLLEG